MFVSLKHYYVADFPDTVVVSFLTGGCTTLGYSPDSYNFRLCWIELQVVLKEPVLNCQSTFVDFRDIDSTISAGPQCEVDLCFFGKLMVLQTSIPNNISDR